MNLRYSPVLQGVKASVKSMFSPPDSESADDEEVGRVIDTDDDGNQLYKEDIIANIHEELEKRRSARSALEIQWHLNANFLVGNQYCDFNRPNTSTRPLVSVSSAQVDSARIRSAAVTPVSRYCTACSRI